MAVLLLELPIVATEQLLGLLPVVLVEALPEVMVEVMVEVEGDYEVPLPPTTLLS